jgi:hypothetical protein
VRRAVPALLVIPLAYLLARFGSSLGVGPVLGLIALCAAVVLAGTRSWALGSDKALDLQLQAFYDSWFGSRRGLGRVTQPEFATLAARVAELEHERLRGQAAVQQMREDLEAIRRPGHGAWAQERLEPIEADIVWLPELRKSRSDWPILFAVEETLRRYEGHSESVTELSRLFESHGRESTPHVIDWSSPPDVRARSAPLGRTDFLRAQRLLTYTVFLRGWNRHSTDAPDMVDALEAWLRSRDVSEQLVQAVRVSLSKRS